MARGCAVRWHDPCSSFVVRKRLPGRGRFVQERGAGEVQDVLRGGARAPRYRDSGGGVFCMRSLADHGQRTRSHGHHHITGCRLMQFAIRFKARWRLEMQLEAVVAVAGDMP